MIAHCLMTNLLPLNFTDLHRQTCHSRQTHPNSVNFDLALPQTDHMTHPFPHRFTSQTSQFIDLLRRCSITIHQQFNLLNLVWHQAQFVDHFRYLVAE